jgi:PAS domain S-box-containing protein
MRFPKLPTVHLFGLSKPEKKILIAVLSILTGLCTMAYFANRNSDRLIVSTEKIDQSETVKNHIREILLASVVIETGIRGYVLTGDENYLASANKATADQILHTHELGSTPNLSPAIKTIVDTLHSTVQAKSELAVRTIEVRRQIGMDKAMAFISEGNEKALMEKINLLTQDLLKEQNTQLAELKASHTEAIRNFALTFYFLLIKIGITVVTVIFLLVFYFIKRNKSDKLLQASRELLYNVIDHTTAIITIKDLSGRYILVNKAFENAFQKTAESIKGKTAFDVFEADAAESIRNTDIEVVRIQNQIKIEENAVVNNEMHHFTSLKFPLFDAHRIPYAVCSISTDDTENIKNEALHQLQMRRVLDLFNNAPCGYQATDHTGYILEINDTLLKWLGYTRDEVVGKIKTRELLSKESQEIYYHYFPRILTGEIKSVFDVEVEYIRKNGTKVSMIANSIAQYDEEGQFMYTRTSLFDVSFRKVTEEMTAQN